MTMAPRLYARRCFARTLAALLTCTLASVAWGDEYVIGVEPSRAVGVSPGVVAEEDVTVALAAFGDAFTFSSVGTPFTFAVRWISNLTVERAGGGDAFVPAAIQARLVAAQEISDVLNDLLALEFRSVGTCDDIALADSRVPVGEPLWDALASAHVGDVIGDEYALGDVSAHDQTTVAVAGRGGEVAGVAELVGPARALLAAAANPGRSAEHITAAVTARQPILGARCGSVAGTGQLFEARVRWGRWSEGAFVPQAVPGSDVFLPAGSYPLRIEIRLVDVATWGPGGANAATDPSPP